MSISEDPSTPSPVHQANSTNGDVTSAAFHPPAQSYVVVLVDAMYVTGVSSATLSCADSLGNSFTGVQVNSSAQESTAGIFWNYYTTAPGASASTFSSVPGRMIPGAATPAEPMNATGGITVTVKSTSFASASWSLVPRVVTGVNSTAASFASSTNVTAMSNSFTTTTSGSWVYVVTGEPINSSQTTDPTTLQIDSWLDPVVMGGTFSGRANSATVTPGATTLGWSGAGTWVAVEFEPATVPSGISGSGGVTFGPVILSGTGTYTPPAALTIIQQVTGTSTYDYGWSTTELTTTAGNALIVLAGWNLSVNVTDGLMPAVNVSDSTQLNYWHHLDTSSAGNTGSRCCAWICLNSFPVEWISVSLSGFASSLAYTIIEVNGLNDYFQLDLTDDASISSGTTISVDGGTTAQPDLLMTVMAAGSTTSAVSSAPSGWTALTQVVSGGAGPNSVAIYPYWKSVSSGASSAASWTMNNSSPLSALVFGVYKTGTAPVQSNPNFPQLKVEMAFGFSPGDPSQAPPTWTDITARAMSGDGEMFINAAMGRTYELTSQEAGTLTIAIDNHDGAFTPGNVNSPYYPYVTIATPVRVSAFWETHWYNIAFGYVERWPQEFPDLPQWGLSKMVAVDCFGVLGNISMFEALIGEMLIDAPYVLLPANEQYMTTVNGLTPVNIAYNAQGLLAANVSLLNQRTGTYVNGAGLYTGTPNTIATVSTGQSTSLLGDEDTGFGTGSISSAPVGPNATGPGIIYTDPNLQDPLSPNGVTIEFWLSISAEATTAGLQPTVFEAFGSASCYQVTSPSLVIQVLNHSGTNQLKFTFADGSTHTTSFSPNPNPQQIVCIFTSSSLTVYINSAQAFSIALSTSQVTSWSAVMLGCANYAYQSGVVTGGNFTAQCLGIYNYSLPYQRVVAHYVTGISGAENVDAVTRIAQILCWCGLGIPRGGQYLFNGVHDGVLQGPAYGLKGAHASDPINQVVTNHAAMVFAAPDGTLTYLHRWALFNQSPVYTFGDSVNLSDGQIPYLGDQKFGFDNTFLYNVNQASETNGPNTGITVTASDFGSGASYFTRSALQVSLQTMSNLDAYDTANWNLSRYTQPGIRLSGMTVDAASNPSVAFLAVLQTRQGNAAVVTRNPLGGASITAPVIVQKVTHSIGPARWQTSYEMSPYTALNDILTLDSPGNSLLGSNTLA